MNEKDLNIEYICEKTLLAKDDELVPIILDLIKESYKAGLCQAEYDNTMGLIEENERLKTQLSGTTFCYDEEEHKQLEEENQKLKKQYEKALNDYCRLDACNNSQQKEFINFLEDNWKQTQDIWYIKILQKYKEIIGVEDENNKQ